MRSKHPTIVRISGVVVSLAVCSVLLGCATTNSEPVGSAESRDADWSQFSGSESTRSISITDAIPESPIEITGAPYVRAVRLAWSNAESVPTYEPANQSLQFPKGTRQAVLMIEIRKLPDDADLRVDWYYGSALVFTDTLESMDDGGHFFSLIKRRDGRLVPLPSGAYRAVVSDGDTEIKTVAFSIEP